MVTNEGLRCSLQADPANSIRGSASRRQQHVHELQGQQPPPHQQQSAPRLQAGSCRQQQDLRPVEVCADCGQHFDTVGLPWKMVHHWRRSSPDLPQSFPFDHEPSLGVEPEWQLSCTQVAELIAHAEAVHVGSAR